MSEQHTRFADCLSFAIASESNANLRRFQSLQHSRAAPTDVLKLANTPISIFFFFTSCGQEELKEPRTRKLRMFAKIIEIADGMGFPKFSNDCEYLDLLRTEDIPSNLGGRIDDHANYFTARMLFLLESRCLYGEEMFNTITANVVASYFTDFPDHRKTFQPIFLMNDICRYWKTMLLNYEHKRHSAGPDAHAKKN
jgi:hypothetical protein